jgi:diguanylate cyclase (GGDEF)-like protein
MDILLAEHYENSIGAPFTDSLTGLYNNGFFQISLENEIKRFERYGNAFSIALVDVDSFSYFNQSHGPLEGDRLLKEVAAVIKKNSREVDLSARYSGNIFAVIVTQSNCQETLIFADRIRQDVAKNSNRESTVSIGLASCPDDATCAQNLLNKANQALVKARLHGKNNIHFAQKEIDTVTTVLPTILIVDDDAQNLKLLEGMLLTIDCNILSATNGIDALKIVEKTAVDLILLDVMMPQMDGYEVCRQLKDREATRLIPVVLVTALNDRMPR